MIHARNQGGNASLCGDAVFHYGGGPQTKPTKKAGDFTRPIFTVRSSSEDHFIFTRRSSPLFGDVIQRTDSLANAVEFSR